jgi:hypothetical protein
LVWLVGMDGNTTALDAGEASALHRMLRRRTQPVGIPTGDTMPHGVPDPLAAGFSPRPTAESGFASHSSPSLVAA